jgi:hypothetical protein
MTSRAGGRPINLVRLAAWSVLAAGTVAAVAQAAPGEPRAPYVQKNVCPFERCAYGIWIARSRLKAYAAEGDTSKAAFHIQPGERVHALRGNVHVVKLGVLSVTAPVEIVAGRMLRNGDRLHVLAYRGEGVYDVWYEGRLLSVEAFWAPLASAARVAGVLTTRPEMLWWVLVKNRGGRQGWLRLRNLAEHGFEIREEICMGPC